MKTKKFDIARYTQAQIVDALTDPLNRHVVRVKFGWDDHELYKHPEKLMENYISEGGAVAFANRRAEFTREIEIPEEDYSI